MEGHHTKTHSCICIYKNCGIKSRDNILNVKFYRLPVNDRDRLITWLVNSGCDDLTEESDAELHKLRICSRHFAPNAVYSSGRLKKTAEPLLYPLKSDDESDISDVNVKIYQDEIRLLRAKVIHKKNIINTLKERNNILRRTIKANNGVITRLRKKILTGNISDYSLLNALKQRVHGFVLTFITMQLCHKQSSYSKEEQQLAQKMHYTSPSLYRKMREEFNFILPGRTTLQNWFNVIDFWPGISTTLFNKLKTKVDCMDQTERNCVLLFDEMRIKKGFDFHVKRQKVEGFEDLGPLGCNKTVATSVLVFMIRGLFHNWKQPVAYFLTGGNMNNVKLSAALDIVIDAIFSTELKLRAVICDQGTNNQSAIKHRISTERPYFMYKHTKIYTMFDMPHIYKSIRNQLLKYNILYDDNKIASWNDLRLLWQLENGKATRAACKLSEKHISPNNFERMKCRLALQVFSRRVSAALLTAGTLGEINSDTVIHTAEYFRILNDSFDSLNSRSCNAPNPNSCALSDSRIDVENSLRELLKDCSKWRTITKNGLKIPPCFQGLQTSVTAILQLWNDLKREGIKFFMTSRVNQDPLENLFSMIRTYGGTYNQNPTAKAFRLLLQKNIVLNLCKPAQSTNCVDDEDETLLPSSLHDIATTCNTDCEFATSADFTHTHADDNEADENQTVDNQADENQAVDNQADDNQELFIDIEQIVIDASYVHNETIEASAIEYFAGFVANKCVNKSGCEQCRASFINENHELTHSKQILTFFRAYETNDDQELGHLCVPTAEFSFVFQLMNAIFDKGYPNIRDSYGILDTLFPLMVQAVDMQYPGWFQHETCSSHRKDLAYYMMKVKLHKDLVWLGDRIRRTKTYSRGKPPQKLINIQSN